MTGPRRNGKTTQVALMRAALQRFTRDVGCQPMTGGVVDGVVWMTAAAPTWGVNGYVLLPKGHPWLGDWPRNGAGDSIVGELVGIHGGVSYEAPPWIGFDTCHYGDRWSAEFDPSGWSRRAASAPWDILWTLERVEREAQRLARQVATYGWVDGNVDNPSLGRWGKWERGINVELGPEFTQMRRDRDLAETLGVLGDTARNVAEAMELAKKVIDTAAIAVADLADAAVDITPPPTTGRFAHLDIPPVQELNTNHPTP